MDLEQLQEQARAVMSPSGYGYYVGGADDEVTLADNVAAWGRMRLRYHVLRDVSKVSTETTLFGTPVSLPVLVAPTGYHKLAHEQGEAATARGAEAAGTIMCVSTLATTSLEDVAAAAPDAPRWFQLYVRKDREFSGELIERSVAAGYRALVFTVDLPVVGHRRRDEANAFTLPEGMQMANVRQEVPSGEGSGLVAYGAAELDPALTFDDIGWVKEHGGDLPVLVKGIVRGDDAVDAIEAGADGIIVSNHGGRQLDHAVATADALPEVIQEVQGRVPVLVDGGVRRGTDVVKAVALGAEAVLIGRPILWGLAAGGADGVRAVLDGFGEELERAMALCGVTSLEEISEDLVTTART